uniref:Uncharacterized protein n=1 Tax=Arundo donax TaxID=35708 RepID=A0A0A9DC45_ARUDO
MISQKPQGIPVIVKYMQDQCNKSGMHSGGVVGCCAVFVFYFVILFLLLSME